MKINSGLYTRQGRRKRNTRRIYFTNSQNQENTKMNLQLLRAKRIEKNKMEEKEVVTFATGNF